jgi:aspartyl-tRNA(Asn)/glutamyl-tRNA(Gln) amidotransferase subunit A
MLAQYRPPYSATAVERLTEAGAVIIGKTNLDEFAMGSSTENSAFHTTRNPWNESYVPGGSSGGSAAAVASGMVTAALGSDTGGSIRQPAGLCGVVGMKGTYGRVSRYGLVAFASSLDQIGPIAGNVSDCAAVMQVISGHDPKDATTIPGAAPDLTAHLGAGLDRMKIAVPSAFAEWDVDASVRRIAYETIDLLKDHGAAVHEVDMPGMETSIASYYVLANAEASSNLSRFDGVRYGCRSKAATLVDMYEQTRGEGFGEEVKRRILLGVYVLSAGYYDAYYMKALRVKARICEEFEKVFRRYDLVLLPTSPTPAFKLGERIDDPISMYLSDIFTTSANIAGLPAISIPAGMSSDGLPVGMQLMAGPEREALMLGGAKTLEELYRFDERFRPKTQG